MDFTEPFEIDSSVERFLDRYGLEGDYEIISEEDDEIIARLTRNVANELKRTYDLFLSGREADRRFARFESDLKNEILKFIRSTWKDIGRDIDIDVYKDQRLDYIAYTIELVLDRASEVVEPRGLFYQADTGADIDDAASSFEWAAWLGIDDSPFYSGDWVDAYGYDQASLWFEEAGDVDYDEIRDAVEGIIESARED